MPLLEDILRVGAPAWAILYRPGTSCDQVDVLVGNVVQADLLADLPLPPLPSDPGGAQHDLLVVIPYRQVRERGFDCHDDGAPLLAVSVTGQETRLVQDVHMLLPDKPVDLRAAGFDLDDNAYAQVVRNVLASEIGNGSGANFVIKRSFTAELSGSQVSAAMVLFRRLLAGERGTYWTFIIHTGERTFVGATPERHISLSQGTAVMNPISGTYRYPEEGPDLAGLTSFLQDVKERDELFMVLDEELKMMGGITASGGRVEGPFLKEMATLAHTEYLVKGSTDRDVRDILRESLLAPTVTGSPLKNACRVIRQYEAHGRGYYSGVVALIGRDDGQCRELDSAILLRTAEIENGHLRLSVGATLVRDSDPHQEVAETHAKAAGMLTALKDKPSAPPGPGPSHQLELLPEVGAALRSRNDALAPFWLGWPGRRPGAFAVPDLIGRRVLIVDAEDTFTSMLGHQLRALGLVVQTCDYDRPARSDGHDLVVLGPGPGDPRDREDPRIDHLHRTVDDLLATGTPFLAVCLSHQVLGLRLGLKVIRMSRTNQGTQQQFELFGRSVRMGFYNSFSVVCPPPGIHGVEVSRGPGTDHVYAMRAKGFASFQFHPESVLSRDGMIVLEDAVSQLLPASSGAHDAVARPL